MTCTIQTPATAARFHLVSLNASNASRRDVTTHHLRLTEFYMYTCADVRITISMTPSRYQFEVEPPKPVKLISLATSVSMLRAVQSHSSSMPPKSVSWKSCKLGICTSLSGLLSLSPLAEPPLKDESSPSSGDTPMADTVDDSYFIRLALFWNGHRACSSGVSDMHRASLVTKVYVVIPGPEHCAISFRGPIPNSMPSSTACR